MVRTLLALFALSLAATARAAPVAYDDLPPGGTPVSFTGQAIDVGGFPQSAVMLRYEYEEDGLVLVDYEAAGVGLDFDRRFIVFTFPQGLVGTLTYSLPVPGEPLASMTTTFTGAVDVEDGRFVFGGELGAVVAQVVQVVPEPLSIGAIIPLVSCCLLRRPRRAA